jgi:hypothetical protein
VINIKKLHTTFLSTLILGNQGFTGEKGLREFQPVTDLLNSKLSNLQIQVTLAKGTNNSPLFEISFYSPFLFSPALLTVLISDTEKKVAPEHANNTLRFFVDLDNLACDKFSGCHSVVEELFQLRPIKEAAAKKRGDQTVLQENKELLQSLGGHVTIAIDWDSFTQTSKFKNDAAYVDFIDKIAERPKTFLVSSGNDWGTLRYAYLFPLVSTSSSSLIDSFPVFFDLFLILQSVNEMVQNSAAVKSGLCKFNKILVRFDPNNKAHQKIGQASTLTATAVHVQSANPDLIITVNLDSPLNCGCGRHLQNIFAQSEFLASEEKTIQSIGMNALCYSLPSLKEALCSHSHL